MTNLEFNNEFDILYDNALSGAAPPIDGYEKSLFLTQAQEEIVKTRYRQRGNKYQEGFEGSEKRRRDLEELTEMGVSTSPFTSVGDALASSNSIFFNIEDDVMFIVQEELRVTSEDECLNNTYIKVKPVTHDEYNTNRKNPFKKSDEDLSWRFDFKKINGNRVVEIVYGDTYTPVEYRYRYLKYPAPIILEDLTEYGTSINGSTATATCELSEHIHREILLRAVELAMKATGNPLLKANVELNRRSE